MIKICISVASHALDPPPPVTNCHTFSDPLPPRAWCTLWTAPLVSYTFNHRSVSAGPEPPGDFHVEKVSGNGSVLLGWTPPVTDDLAQRGGSAVAGYKVPLKNGSLLKKCLQCT